MQNYLESFGIFDIELLPMPSSPLFLVYGKNEISFLAEQFFPEKSVESIMIEWEEFKENFTDNNLKLKEAPSELAL